MEKTDEEISHLAELKQLYKAWDRTHKEWTPYQIEQELSTKMEYHQAILHEKFGYESYNDIRQKAEECEVDLPEFDFDDARYGHYYEPGNDQEMDID